MEGGKKAREFNTESDKINPNSEDTITSGKEITQCTDIPYLYTLELQIYTFVRKNDDTKQRD